MTGIVEAVGARVIGSAITSVIVRPLFGGDRVRIRAPVVPGSVRQQQILGTEYGAVSIDSPRGVGRTISTATRADVESGGFGTGRGTAGQQGGGGIGSGGGGSGPARQRGGGFTLPKEGPIARIIENIIALGGGLASYELLKKVFDEIFGGETPEQRKRRERAEREEAMRSAEIDIEGYERRIDKARERGKELEREAKEAAAATRKRIEDADKAMREEIAAAEKARKERIARIIQIGSVILTAGTAIYDRSVAAKAARASVAGGPIAEPPVPTRRPRPTTPAPQLGFAGPITGFGAPSAAELGIDIGLATPTALAAGQSVVKCETVKTRSKKKRGVCRAGFFQEFTDSTRYVTWREAPCKPPSQFAIARGFFA